MEVDGIDEIDEFVVSERTVAPLLVLLVDHLLHLDDQRIRLGNAVLLRKLVIVIDPERNARKPARLIDGDTRGTL